MARFPHSFRGFSRLKLPGPRSSYRSWVSERKRAPPEGGSRCKVAVCRILKFTLSQIVTGVILPYLEKMCV